MTGKTHTHIYIIGIGGKGLNSIAEFCVEKGYRVSGSDLRESDETRALRGRGVHVNLEQCAGNISDCIDTVVYSSIITDDHPELVEARRLGIKTVSRPEFLAELTTAYTRISIAGSHGKSTTSAMAALALKAQLGSVNAITGAPIKEVSSYQIAEDSSYCVVEACEYAKSFLHLPGDYSIVTTLEKSHMEYFGSEARMNDAFREFVEAHTPESTLIINGDSYELRKICLSHPGRIVTCGFNTSNDYVIRDIKLGKDSSTFSLYRADQILRADVIVRMPGTYSILNVALVLVLLDQLRVPADGFMDVLQTFTGVGRRFEISRRNAAVFVDDFAHHPTQVRNLLKGLRQFFPDRDIVAIFEPRQYHLIRTFLREYGKAFVLAKEVCVTSMVPALGDTEEDIRSITHEDVMESVSTYSKPESVWYAGSYEEIVERLGGRDLSNAVVATVGAGNIYQVRDLLANRVQ